MKYQIKDWQKNFENDRSRRVNNCRFVCVPNKFGLGIRRVLSQPRGHEMFGVFILLVEALSTQPAPREGWLTDDGTEEGSPWTAEDVAVRVGHGDIEFIKKTMQLLCSKEVGWIRYDSTHHQLTTHSPPTHHALTLNGREGKEGKEWKEGKKEESAGSSPARLDEGESRKPEAGSTSPDARQPTAIATPKPEARSETKNRRQPTGSHAELIAHFTDRWEARYGAKFPFSAKDAAHAKWILNQVSDLEQAKSAVDAYLAANDEFYERDRHGLGLLVAQFRRFIVPKKSATTAKEIRARMFST